MNRQGIKAFIKKFGSKSCIIQDNQEWVNTQCLLPWKHSRGIDSRPSAGISVHDNSPSVYKCYGCGATAKLASLVRQIGERNKIDYSAYSIALDVEENTGISAREWPEEYTPEEPPPILDKDIYLDLYGTAYNNSYVLSRGVSNATAEKIQLRYDSADSTGEPRILFPVFSRTGGLYGFSGRAINDDAVPKIRNYYGLKKKWMLLGAHLLPKKPDYVILVEGLFGYARFVENNQNVVASMGADLSDYQAQILTEIGAPVYCFYDQKSIDKDTGEIIEDAAGKAGTQVVKRKLKDHLPVLKVRLPRSAVDIDDLSKDQIEHMIRDARVM